jgi:APA family basic amino acid/polyamine antiporter
MSKTPTEPSPAVDPKKPARKARIGAGTCTAIVVANMVGTGVFTSLGWQIVAGVESGFAICLLWALGGLVALAGALTYAELASVLPRSGGEYHFLSKLYHPSLGFMAGLVSATVGFAAPVAVASIAFGSYFANLVPQVSPMGYSAGIVTLVTLVHLWSIGIGKTFQNVFTLFKVTLVVVLILAGFLFAEGQGNPRWAPAAEDLGMIFSSGFALSLFFVMYSYSGWNAAVYIVNEVREPEVNVGRGLLAGTALVTVLYVGLNAMMLYAAPAAEYAQAVPENVDFAHIAARYAFGEGGGALISGLISLGLISTISAMVWAGPRVLAVMGEDVPALGFFARRGKTGVPVPAMIFQYVLTLLFLIPGFEQTVMYASFSLIVCSLLTVAGIFIHRGRHPAVHRPFRCLGYPVTPLFFIVIMILGIIFAFPEMYWEFFAGLATLVVTWGLYFVLVRVKPFAGNGPQSKS